MTNDDSCDTFSKIYNDSLFADNENDDHQITSANQPISDEIRSPCIDASDSDNPSDPAGTVIDLGALFYDQLPLLISTSDSLQDFGIVNIGEQLDLHLTIQNFGIDSLITDDITNHQSVFTQNRNLANNIILPGDSLSIMTTFTRVDSNLIVDTLLIEDNGMQLQVQLSGKSKAFVGIV